MVRTSDYLWAFGGGLYNTSFLWSIRKEKWINGPTLPSTISEGCGLQLDVHQTILYTFSTHPNSTCIDKWMYNWNLQLWNLTDCFIDLPDSFYKHTIGGLTCSSFWDKSGYLYQLLHVSNGFEKDRFYFINHNQQIIGHTIKESSKTCFVELRKVGKICCSFLFQFL